MIAKRALTLYGRGGCSPCLEADRILRPIAARHSLELRWVDVDLEDAPEGYRDEVPVVTYGEEVIARGRVVAAAVEEAIEMGESALT